MHWHPTARFPIELDMRPFLAYLEGQGVLCRVNESNGEQLLMVQDASMSELVARRSQEWLAGELDVPHTPTASLTVRSQWLPAISWQKLFFYLPITVLTLFLGALGTLLVSIDYPELRLVSLFLYQPLESGYILPISEVMRQGEYWRLVTPAFIHFGLLHFVFNALLIWVFGSRIEMAKGSLHVLSVFITIALLSNLTQFLSEADTVFGGLSGVAYGYVGYVAAYQSRVRHPILYFHPPILAVLVIWLFLGFFGVMDFFVQGQIANAAHLGGLVSGALLGFLSALLKPGKVEPGKAEPGKDR